MVSPHIQEGAGCLLSGTSLVCQCYLDYLPTTSTTSLSSLQPSCPATGSCLARADSPCDQMPCYGGGDTRYFCSATFGPYFPTLYRVCPYCSATKGNLTYTYVTGSGHGPLTYDGEHLLPQ